MTNILNSQSDAIVVVNSAETLFCNSKSIQLFGFDPVGQGGTEEEKQFAETQLKLPQFLPLDKNSEAGHPFD